MAFHHRVSGLANLALLPSFPNVPRYKGLEPPTVELIGDNVRAEGGGPLLSLCASYNVLLCCSCMRVGVFALQKHVSEEAVHLVLKSRSSKDVMFVSDAISVPLSGRQFTYCGRQVSVSDDASQVVLSESGIVAGELILCGVGQRAVSSFATDLFAIRVVPWIGLRVQAVDGRPWMLADGYGADVLRKPSQTTRPSKRGASCWSPCRPCAVG